MNIEKEDVKNGKILIEFDGSCRYEFNTNPAIFYVYFKNIIIEFKGHIIENVYKNNDIYIKELKYYNDFEEDIKFELLGCYFWSRLLGFYDGLNANIKEEDLTDIIDLTELTKRYKNLKINIIDISKRKCIYSIK